MHLEICGYFAHRQHFAQSLHALQLFGNLTSRPELRFLRLPRSRRLSAIRQSSTVGVSALSHTAWLSFSPWYRTKSSQKRSSRQFIYTRLTTLIRKASSKDPSPSV